MGVRNLFFSVYEGLIFDIIMIDGCELISFVSYNYFGLLGDLCVNVGVLEVIE